jgi:hypothetical protein
MIHTPKILTAALLAVAALTLSPASVHAGHVYAGLTDSNGNSILDANDALVFYSSNSILTATPLSSLGPFSMTLQISGNQSGLYLSTSPTFTALANGANGTVLDAGATVITSGNYAASLAATAGSLIQLQIYSVSGPDGGTFSFWESGATSATYSFTIGTTLAGSLGKWDLTDTTSNVTVNGTTNGGNPPLDPFGHIHNRSFTADLPGTYTVSYVLSDAINTGRDASSPFTVTYTVVPEPSSFLAIGAGSALLALLRFRRRTA